MNDFRRHQKRIDQIVSTLPFMMRFLLSTLERSKTAELRIVKQVELFAHTKTHAPAFSTVHSKTRFQIDALSMRTRSEYY